MSLPTESRPPAAGDNPTLAVPDQRPPANAGTAKTFTGVRRVRITDEQVEFFGRDGELVGKRTPKDVPQEVLIGGPPAQSDLARAVDEAQKNLIGNISEALQSSMTRIGSSFNWHLRMNIAVFAVGLGSFALAAWKALDNPGQADAITSAAFGGLSAAAFITYFVSRPLAAVAAAGPEMAWVLATVNTYWTKLIYLNDPRTMVAGLEAAQRDFEKSMALFMTTVNYQDRVAPVPEQPSAGATGATGASGASGSGSPGGAA